MSTRKSILKKGVNNKGTKKVTINLEKNEGFNDNPHPITPRSKSARWATNDDANYNREQERNKQTRFLMARRSVPYMAATAARNKKRKLDKTGRFVEDRSARLSRSAIISRNREEDLTWRDVEGETKKQGPIPYVVDSVFRLFGKKGGRKTRKNFRKK
jgi:hypothetical protein